MSHKIDKNLCFKLNFEEVYIYIKLLILWILQFFQYWTSLKFSVIFHVYNSLKTGSFTTQNNPKKLKLQLQLNLYPFRPISGRCRCHPTPPHPYL